MNIDLDILSKVLLFTITGPCPVVVFYLHSDQSLDCNILTLTLTAKSVNICSHYLS